MKDSSVSRREFVKLAAVTVAAGAVATIFPGRAGAAGPGAGGLGSGDKTGAVAFQGLYYRPAPDGSLQIGAGQNGPWKPGASFGPDCPMKSLALVNGQLQATLQTAGYGFAIKSGDGKTWYTLGFQAPAHNSVK